MKKAAFLDRDGVINRKRPEGMYVTTWADFEFLPGVAQALTALSHAGFLLIVISNQRCVAKGLLTAANLDSIHQRMCAELAAAGAVITAGYYCPHDLQPACTCRKPLPGLLLEAAREHDICLPESWMIGDSESDIEAGKRAGCRTARIHAASRLDSSAADISAESLTEAAQEILAADSRVSHGLRA